MFAQNLRERLRARGAISRMAEATGISPVQINRYLKGTIPNEANLHRIAHFLEIEEHELFTIEHGAGWQHLKQFMTAAQRSLEINRNRKSIASRYCYLYFSIPDVSGKLLRSVVLIEERIGYISFTRHTKFRLGPPDETIDPMTTHRGVIVDVEGQDCLFGFAECGPHEPSLIVVEGAGRGRRLRYGSAIVGTFEGLKPLKVVMSVSENGLEREPVVDRAGIVSTNDIPHGSAIESFLHSAGVPEISISTGI